MTIKHEIKYTLEEICALADVVYNNDNIGAGPASGSFKTKGMIIIPCSMKTVSGTACGYIDNLFLRVADVTLKERRKLVMVVRECPFSTIHLENMHKLSSIGVIIMPMVLSFYNHPDGLDACVNHLVCKILDQFDIEVESFLRWRGM